MTFGDRLQKAIRRGQRLSTTRADQERERALSEEELRRLYSEYRLPLSDHIESCLRELPSHFPGFQYQSILDDRGWGGQVSRDDVRFVDRQRRSEFSRLEMTIRPFSSAHVLELVAKGTIRNKELFRRTHYRRLGEADVDSFRELIDLWVLEYAEAYAARE